MNKVDCSRPGRTRERCRMQTTQGYEDLHEARTPSESYGIIRSCLPQHVYWALLTLSRALSYCISRLGHALFYVADIYPRRTKGTPRVRRSECVIFFSGSLGQGSRPESGRKLCIARMDNIYDTNALFCDCNVPNFIFLVEAAPTGCFLAS